MHMVQESQDHMQNLHINAHYEQAISQFATIFNKSVSCRCVKMYLFVGKDKKWGKNAHDKKSLPLDNLFHSQN